MDVLQFDFTILAWFILYFLVASNEIYWISNLFFFSSITIPTRHQESFTLSKIFEPLAAFSGF